LGLGADDLDAERFADIDSGGRRDSAVFRARQRVELFDTAGHQNECNDTPAHGERS
jgi:hypothetical protein